MEYRYAPTAQSAERMSTEELRREFLCSNLFLPDRVTLSYSDVDRYIIGGAAPKSPLKLEGAAELVTQHFTERREVGVVNVGGAGSIKVDGERFDLRFRDALYIGAGSQEVIFSSADPANPANFYFVSLPAHQRYPTTPVILEKTAAVHLGDVRNSNKRTIYKLIHPEGVKSCQLVMGITRLEDNCVWNTMPCHTHRLRSEVYFYFELGSGLVSHFMGEPSATRHLIVRDKEAVLSPSWSIHSGCGTQSYSFIWAMGGDNQVFSDMQAVPMETLK